MRISTAIVLFAMVGAWVGPSAHAAGEMWQTDYDNALKEAKAAGKHLLVDFSGSDWCGWCIRLDNEVFSQEEFVSKVTNDYVLVVLDFPRKPENLEKIPEAQRERNRELMNKFGVAGFPTVLLFDPSGNLYGRTGYQRGGPEAYLGHLEEMRAKREKIAAMRAPLADGGLAAGEEAKLLDKIISQTDNMVANAVNRDDMRRIVELDADNALGLKSQYQMRLGTIVAETAMKDKDYEGAIVAYQKLIDELKPTGEGLQEIYYKMVGPYYYQREMDKVSEYLEKALTAAPESAMASRIEKMLERFKAEDSGPKPPTPSARDNLAKGKDFLAENAAKEGVKTTASGLQYLILKEGDGVPPGEDDTVTVHYRGTTIDGKEFDSSYKRGEPISFALSKVIKGWTEGLQLVKPGGKAKLFIPSDLAYGEKGAGQDIGPNEVLIFEVELISVGK